MIYGGTCVRVCVCVAVGGCVCEVMIVVYYIVTYIDTYTRCLQLTSRGYEGVGYNNWEAEEHV